MGQKSRTAEASFRFPPTIGAKGDVASNAVLAAARITELMELAAERLVQQELGGADSSVAIAMNFAHADPRLTSADFCGAIVRAVASRRGVAGKLHFVVIDAFDESGLIASAEQTIATAAIFAVPERSRCSMVPAYLRARTTKGDATISIAIERDHNVR